MTAVAVENESRIECKICNAKVHSIQLHLQREHTDLGMSLADYQSKYPDAPILSKLAQQKIDEHAAAAKSTKASVGADSALFSDYTTCTQPLHELFGLGENRAAMNSRGLPIPVTVVMASGPFSSMVPDLDPNYLFNLEILKTLMLGIEMRIPTYLWGHAGTGKTTAYEQICARTGRPMLRVQHTANMEEEHVLGGWRLRDGKTFFELGPLAMAMKHGWLYMADEYDFGRPEVLSLYQPVLENKPLVIKEADLENRIIRPHPNFRFVATGNTNGQGDETGLYTGTTMQNAANYERFGIVEKMNYMDETVEAALVSKQAQIPVTDARRLVDFANRIRGQFEAGELSNPISPRSLIYAGRIGFARSNYITGLEKSFINRLTAVDKEAATQLASRVFSTR